MLSRIFRPTSNKIGPIFGTIVKNFIRFKQNENGNIAIMAVVSLLPIILCVGAAVDYSRISLVKSSITSALDSALLAAGRGLSSGSLADNQQQVESYINAMVAANLDQSGISGLAYTVDNIDNDSENGTLSADIQTDLQMSFMSLANLDTANISSHTEVTYGNQKVELAMMLDVTGSMEGSKIAALKVAALDAVKILLPATAASSDKMRIGLVPYSSSVNAGIYADDVTDYLSEKCVTERAGAEAYSDASPIAFPLGADSRANDPGNSCPSQAIRPLTTKRDELLKDINKYSAGGSTAGHLGVAWSYYMLSPNWDKIWPDKAEANPYGDKKILKIALLMTDGEFNTYYDGIDGITGVTWYGNGVQSNNAAAELCTDMRNKGIVIYSVVFSVPTSAKELPTTAKKLLQACASPDDDDGIQHYYDATSGAELKEAFTDIAKSIKTLRISK